MPFTGTDATILIISHGAIIAGIKGYLRSQGCKLHDSIRMIGDKWDCEKKYCVHCSISEIVVGMEGPEAFLRVGDSSHLEVLRNRKFAF
jgi:hypothetical protein